MLGQVVRGHGRFPAIRTLGQEGVAAGRSRGGRGRERVGAGGPLNRPTLACDQGVHGPAGGVHNQNRDQQYAHAHALE